jgi:hypothetical protein
VLRIGRAVTAATGVQTISATTLGTPFTNITAPRFYGVEVGAHF